MLVTDLQRIKRSRRLPAIAAAAHVDGEIRELAVTGIRVVGSDKEVALADKWHIGSCTKSMTATLAGILIEKGYLDWNTQIADVFGDWCSEIEPGWHKVTLEQLLSHHGGAPNVVAAADWGRAYQKIGTPTEQRMELVRSTLSLAPDAVAGSKYIYSNTGYAIAGLMIETVRQQAWESLIEELVFRPLNMNSAGFGAPGTAEIDQPFGHVRGNGKLFPLVPGPDADNPPAIAPGATVHCSIEDLLKFAASHAGDGALVGRNTLQRLHRRYGASEYGAGWLVLDRDWGHGYVLSHDGSNTYWFASMWIAPFRKAAFVAASNAPGPHGQKGCADAVNRMIGTVLQ